MLDIIYRNIKLQNIFIVTPQSRIILKVVSVLCIVAYNINVTLQELKCGGLNMINVKCMFMSFKAVWISRLLSCDPSIHSWAQIASLYYKPFMECNNNLVFYFDESIDFPDLNNVSHIKFIKM